MICRRRLRSVRTVAVGRLTLGDNTEDYWIYTN